MSDQLFETDENIYKSSPFGIQFVIGGPAVPSGIAQPIKAQRGVRQIRIGKPKSWKEQAAQVANELMMGKPPFKSPLTMIITFYSERPDNHYVNGQLRAGVAKYPVLTASTVAYVQPLMTALTGVVWVSAGQVVEQVVRKEYGEARTEVKIGVKI